MVKLPYGQFYQKSRAAFRGVPGLNPNHLVGETVEINGDRYKVIGAEVFATKNVTGKPFSLVVQKER